MSRDLFAIFDAYGFRCGDPDSDCSKARAAVAELIEAANVLEANASRPANGMRSVNAEDIDRLRAVLAAVQP